MYFPRDTIFAEASPPGTGAISIIRVSGDLAEKIVQKHFRSGKKKCPVDFPGEGVYGSFIDQKEREVDDVVAVWHAPGRSYTGEALAEISCHGNPLIVRIICEAIQEMGARIADPGEFTLRRLLNGKIDLSQAEAINEFIKARTERQLEVAARIKKGQLASQLKAVKERIVNIYIQLESAIEFGEEQGAGIPRENLQDGLGSIHQELAFMIQGWLVEKRVKEGLRVSIAGRPNVGKSSIFNALLSEDRAIVSASAGTTRDVLREKLEISGIEVTLMDTAGIRKSKQEIEKEGIRRSRENIEKADICLLILDAQKGWSPGDERIRKLLGDKKIICIWNKRDLLGDDWVQPAIRRIAKDRICISSAKDRYGIDEIRKKLETVVSELCPKEADFFVINYRQQDALQKSHAAVGEAERAIAEGYSEEFILIHLRKALNCLGEITGEVQPEDILQGIFMQFCIGK